LTPEARRARRWSFGLGLASSLAIVAISVLVLVMGLLLALSRGPAPVIVPDVQGKTLEEGQQILASKGLQGKASYGVYSDSVAAGSVVSQRPYAGKIVKEGRVVDLVISRGPKSVQVPALVGKRLSEAEELLKQSYLQVGRVRREPSDQTADTILEQQPAAGKTADRDSAVDLRVSGGEHYGAWEGPGGEDWVFQKLNLVVPAGPSLQRVQVVLETNGENQVLYDEMNRPGDKVSLDIRGKRGAKVKVYLEEKRIFTQNL
jgi:serine/threonine-protein kinase